MTSGAASPPAGPRWRRHRERNLFARHPLGIGLWAGLVLLGFYLVAAISALVVFRSSLGQLPPYQPWVPNSQQIRPSYAHPFGVLPGLGTGLFSAMWKATPWDLAIVAGILALDTALGWMLGALAGLREGGLLDTVITFVGDTLGSIPSFFLVVAVFAGFATIDPRSVNIPVFVLLFGLVIWPATARTTRDRARLIAREPFLESARASGAGTAHLYFRHILPNSVSPLLAQLPIDVAPIFFVLTVFPWFYYCESGVHAPPGLPPPPYLVPYLPPYSPLPSANFPEWGNFLAVGTCEGFTFATGATYWWMFVFPLLAIVGLGIGIALVCDGLDRRMTVH